MPIQLVYAKCCRLYVARAEGCGSRLVVVNDDDLALLESSRCTSV